MTVLLALFLYLYFKNICSRIVKIVIFYRKYSIFILIYASFHMEKSIKSLLILIYASLFIHIQPLTSLKNFLEYLKSKFHLAYLNKIQSPFYTDGYTHHS